jgi:hypothetical protein
MYGIVLDCQGAPIPTRDMEYHQIISDAAFTRTGFAYYKQAATTIALDPTIRPLVALLNTHPGIATIGSCGGHTDPTPLQQPAGRWFVSFMIASWNQDGEDGLAWIAAARAADHRIALAEAYNGTTFFLTGSDEALAAFTRRLAETAPTA